MRTFKHFPGRDKCPICGTNENKECVLVAIAGTQRDNICEALPIHLDCIDLTYMESAFDEDTVLIQKFHLKAKPRMR